MAALLLRRLLLPQRHSTKYTPVRPTITDSDLEQGASTDFGIAMSETYTTEKTASSDTYSCPARINPRIISDATIGLSDGLTVPFALTAGLSALGDSRIVIYSGFAELIAGGISMGLGGYLGAKSEAEAYQAALTETRLVVADDSGKAANFTREAFSRYNFPKSALQEITTTLLASPEQMVDFLMHFHHQLAEADYTPSRPYICGLTIALGYVLGGLVALLPYLFIPSVDRAFTGSVVVMAFALFAFGWVKTLAVGETTRSLCFKNGIQMMVLGGVAAGAAIGCVKAVGG